MIPNDLKAYIVEQKKLGTSFENIIKDLEDKKLSEDTIFEVAKFWYSDDDPNAKQNAAQINSDSNKSNLLPTDRLSVATETPSAAVPTSNNQIKPQDIPTPNINTNADPAIDSDSIKIVDESQVYTNSVKDSANTINQSDSNSDYKNPADDVLVLDVQEEKEDEVKSDTNPVTNPENVLDKKTEILTPQQTIPTPQAPMPVPIPTPAPVPVPSPTPLPTPLPMESPKVEKENESNPSNISGPSTNKNTQTNSKGAKDTADKPKTTGYTINTTPPPVMVGLMTPPKPKYQQQYNKENENKTNITTPTSNTTTNGITTTPASYGELEIVRDQLIKPKYIIKFAKFLAIVLVLLVLSSPFLITFNVVPMENKMIKNIAKRIVYAIPFIQPDPLYILENMLQAHKENPSLTMDVNLTSSSQNLLEFTEINKFELRVNGEIDYSDINNKKLSLKIAMADAVDADVRLLNKDIYFKVNKVPPALTSYLSTAGIDRGGILNNWIHSEAPEANEVTDNILNEEEVTIDPKNQQAFDILRDYMLEKTEVETVELENQKLFKLTTRLNRSDFSEIQEQLKNMEGNKDYQYQDLTKLVEILNIELLIEKDSFYLKNAIVNTTINPNSQGISAYTDGKLSDDAINFALVYNAKDFGKKSQIIVPDTSITMEEFIARIMGTSEFIPPVEITEESEDTDETNDTELEEELEELGEDVTLSEPIQETSASPFGDIISRILNSQLQNQ